MGVKGTARESDSDGHGGSDDESDIKIPGQALLSVNKRNE